MAELNWTQPDKWHWTTDCGKYFVNKALVMDTPIYTALHKGQELTFLYCGRDRAKAKQAAENHAKEDQPCLG